MGHTSNVDLNCATGTNAFSVLVTFKLTPWNLRYRPSPSRATRALCCSVTGFQRTKLAKRSQATKASSLEMTLAQDLPRYHKPPLSAVRSWLSVSKFFPLIDPPHLLQICSWPHHPATIFHTRFSSFLPSISRNQLSRNRLIGISMPAIVRSRKFSRTFSKPLNFSEVPFCQRLRICQVLE